MNCITLEGTPQMLFWALWAKKGLVQCSASLIVTLVSPIMEAKQITKEHSKNRASFVQKYRSKTEHVN